MAGQQSRHSSRRGRGVMPWKVNKQSNNALGHECTTSGRVLERDALERHRQAASHAGGLRARDAATCALDAQLASEAEQGEACSVEDL
eukprot:scaffold7900_cov363-Prasinococcus_capsulatus_cf.AAC.3